MTKARREIWAIIIIGTAISLAVYVMQSDARSARLSSLLTAKAQNAHNLITQDLKLRIDSVERLSAHWSHLPERPVEMLNSDAALLRGDMPGFLAVSVLGVDGAIVAVQPEVLQHMVGRNFPALGPMRADLFDAARRERATVVSRATELRGGSGAGFLMLFPLLDGEEMEGAVLVVLNFELWLTNVFFGAAGNLFSDLEAQVFFGDELILATDGYRDGRGAPVTIEGALTLDRRLTLRARPGAGLRAETGGFMPEMVGVLLLMMFLALAMIRLALDRAQAAARQVIETNGDLLIANEQLSDQIEHRRAAEMSAHLANDARSQFLRSMSHEIRTPMNGVLGLTALLQRTELDARQRQMLSAISTSGKALMAVINDVLDFSQIGSGESRITLAPFDLRACIDDVIRSLGVDIAERGLSVSHQYPDELAGLIVGDCDKVRQMVRNVVSNAIKFTPLGDIAISVNAAENDVVIRVKDTGIGIPADKLKCIFDEFRQVDGEENRAYGGAGLGLAITRHIARALGGDVSVSSVLGAGSEFAIRFPLKMAEAERAGASGRMRHAAA